MRPRLKALPRWTYYLQPAMAGLAIGIIGLKFPQVMGAGYEYMDQAMHGQFLWQTLVALALLKVLATSLSLSSGAPGGIFAPTLFVGAMVGAAVGTLQHRFFPGFTGPLGSYALVGMGTLFAGFLRVPMTSVFMVLEVSGNYSIILPVLVSNTIAYLICLRFQPTPLFDLITREDGLDLPSMEETPRTKRSLRVEKRHAQTAGPDSEIFRHGRRCRLTYRGRHRRDTGRSACSWPTTIGRWTIVAPSTLQELLKAGRGDAASERCSAFRPHSQTTSRPASRFGAAATARRPFPARGAPRRCAPSDRHRLARGHSRGVPARVRVSSSAFPD